MYYKWIEEWRNQPHTYRRDLETCDEHRDLRLHVSSGPGGPSLSPTVSFSAVPVSNCRSWKFCLLSAYCVPSMYTIHLPRPERNVRITLSLQKRKPSLWDFLTPLVGGSVGGGLQIMVVSAWNHYLVPTIAESDVQRRQQNDSTGRDLNIEFVYFLLWYWGGCWDTVHGKKSPHIHETWMEIAVIIWGCPLNTNQPVLGWWECHMV